MNPPAAVIRLLSAVLPLLLSVVPLTGAARQPTPLVTGLDHVIILINDLDAAATRYRAMGFALKPGLPMTMASGTSTSSSRMERNWSS